MSSIDERVSSDEVVSGNSPSILSSLKERRQQVLEQQVLRLPVPRWDDPVIVVRYQPVEHSFIRLVQERVTKATGGKKAAVEIDANADILIRGCLGVVAILDGVEYSLRPGDENGEPTRFDSDLASNLGVEGVNGNQPTARAVVKALFLTEGDILSAVNEVVKFSGYRETEADSVLLGE
jgi:hypothetical protein